MASSSSEPSGSKKLQSTFVPFVVVLTLASLALPVCWGLGFFHKSHVELDEQLLFIVAVAICIGFWLLSCLVLHTVLHPRASASDPFLALFSFFAFTCMVDLVLAFNIDGHLDWLDFYLQHGERYLQSPYGAAINYWDGLVHFPLYLFLVHSISNGPVSNYLAAGSFWFGSVMNSLVVFLPGNAIGSFALELKLSFLLNVPFVIVPLCFLYRLLVADGLQPRRQVLNWPFFRFAMLISTVITIFVYTTRYFVVLDSPLEFVRSWVTDVEPVLLDPHKYPTLQSVVDFLYRVPAILLLLLSTWRTTVPSWVLTLSWLNFGAAAQGAFSFAWTGANYPNMDQTDFAFAVGEYGFHLLQAILVLNSAFFVAFFHASPALEEKQKTS